MTILAVVFGVGLVAWLLLRQTKKVEPLPIPDDGVDLGKGDIYSKGFKLIVAAITDPNSIQHELGLPGSDGWGSDIFAADYGSLPDDVKLYRTFSLAAWQAQHPDASAEVKKQGWAVAQTIMPAIADGKCCDFDKGVPLARGHGSMTYLGNYRVSFNQDGVQREGTMRKLDPPHYDTNADDWGFKWIERVSGQITREGTTAKTPTDIINRLSTWVKI